jgi:predicted adenine nucleotide alpha hydrolase (AANH) superfamily ATPase
MKEATYRRRESEAKRLAREHALHAVAHLNSGNYESAANQFDQAAAYTTRAERARRSRRA